MPVVWRYAVVGVHLKPLKTVTLLCVTVRTAGMPAPAAVVARSTPRKVYAKRSMALLIAHR